LHIGGAEFVKHLDDAIPTEVGRIRHRRPPVARHSTRVLVKQLRMRCDQRSHRLHVVPPNGVGHATGEDKPRPSREAVAPRQSGLRVGQSDRFDVYRTRMVLLQHVARRLVAAPDAAKQILGLVTELIEVWANGEMAEGHGGPRSLVPGL
jgi:hypothetical protein